MTPPALVRDLKLKGLKRPVRLAGIEESTRTEDYFPSWPHRIVDATRSEAAVTIAKAQDRYRVTSPFQAATKYHDTAVNAFCDAIAALPYAQADEDPHLLCLHSAAVAVDGRAILFPAVRRSGKSLLSVLLACRGAELIADDVVGVSARPSDQLRARASGISARLRLPLPDNLDPSNAKLIEGIGGVKNKQYNYVISSNQAEFGTLFPIGAVVMLDRQDEGPATLEPISRGETLRRLLHQNFCREQSSQTIMSALYLLAESARSWRLTYSRPQDGANTVLAAAENDLIDYFARPPRIPKPAELSVQSDAFPSSGARLQRTTSADVRSLDGDHFAVARDGSRIVHLDAGAMRIWTILSGPASVAEVIEYLMAAFPQADPHQVATDTARTLRQFHDLGLIH